MKVLHERVAGIDVHKKMIKVAIRSPGDKPWTRKTEILTFRTFYGVLRAMARELRRRGVTHVAMEASGVYTDPVYYALCEEDFTEVLVVNPAHVKKPGRGGEYRPVGPVQLRPGVLAAQHGDFVAQDQQLGIPGRRPPCQHHPPGQLGKHQVEHPYRHKPAILPALGAPPQPCSQVSNPMPSYGTQQGPFPAARWPRPARREAGQDPRPAEMAGDHPRVVGADVDSLTGPRQSAVEAEVNDVRMETEAIDLEFELTVRLELPAAGSRGANIFGCRKSPAPSWRR